MLSTESFWESIRESATARVVLPEGVKDLEQAAHRFLDTLTAEQWTQLDQVFQDQVLALRDGLQKALLGSSDLSRHLVAPLINQAVTCLGSHLPITDVAQVEFTLQEQPQNGYLDDLNKRMEKYFARAASLLRHPTHKRRSGVHQVVAVGAGGPPEEPQSEQDGANAAKAEPPPDNREHCFLLIPASEAGKRYGEQAQQVLPDLHLVNVPGQADLMFCREQAELSLEDLERLLRACRPAYDESIMVPQASPHARFDIQDWMPLDP
jgi:hypothetical protein